MADNLSLHYATRDEAQGEKKQKKVALPQKGPKRASQAQLERTSDLLNNVINIFQSPDLNIVFIITSLNRLKFVFYF